MKFFNKISDWATGNSASFQKEEESYSKSFNEIKVIDDLLDIALNSDIALEYPFTYQGREMDIYSFKSLIEAEKNRMYRASSYDYRRLDQEVRQLEKEYKIYSKQIKDILLGVIELIDVQEHVRNLNIEIYQNARLEAYQQFLDSNIVNKKWTTDELEDLKNNISRRREIIIPYLGNLKR